jgi:A/G-specific adenine glycosylase
VQPQPAELLRVRAALIAWYAAERRDFPWRRTRDPYAVLVSEVMLQQTQSARVAVRFPAWMARFPTADALARASEADVLTAWSGLGYNRRALSLRRAAAAVSRSGWPRDVAGLELLPGVGAYTARAVASLAFGEPVGVVDTNVRRWLVRRFGVSPDDGGGLQRLADALARPPGRSADATEAAAWTHATMELGRVCRPRGPRCEECPISRGCRARARDVTVPVVSRQPRFTGSRRASRGALVRLLSEARDGALREAAAREALAAAGHRLGGADWERLVDGLERDGLVHRARGQLRLGGAPGAGTIGG